ncbi:hypothetical protein Caci_6589 [Catenulispora acidiphila DSM 44928]|uniref:Uncharacterized protein n=1 Tax=Catenulispora acidiphila (strain DSM 44928 / JCM 14897 / NBRC 102108 / NRRL B-24433 / ID139908) TaxID=479433 RepID=C7PYE5_CATAD|nr:hypothetical protein [Catenulispora acidiphila]ACU75435.1 hypothetical protein Caci_6589 [Catenulispora acidiphila DSM 44928]
MLTTISSVHRRRLSVGAAAFAVMALSVAGCGSGSSSAGASASSQVSSAASSLASQGGSAASQAASSASSAASSALAQVTDGVTAASDVTAGPATTGSDGRAECPLTVRNPTSDPHDYTISVAFDDPNGNLLDATVVTVSAVPANGTATATARSNRDLSGSIAAKITAAVRH